MKTYKDFISVNENNNVVYFFNEQLNSQFFTRINHYANNAYMLYSEEFEDIIEDNFMIEIEYNRKYEEYTVDFDYNLDWLDYEKYSYEEYSTIDQFSNDLDNYFINIVIHGIKHGYIDFNNVEIHDNVIQALEEKLGEDGLKSLVGIGKFDL